MTEPEAKRHVIKRLREELRERHSVDFEAMDLDSLRELLLAVRELQYESLAMGKVGG